MKIILESVENLVFQGGSIKGIAYIGALQTLMAHSNFELTQIKRVAGTSAGAITAALVAVNYVPQEIDHLLGSLNLLELMDESQGNTRNLVFATTASKKKTSSLPSQLASYPSAVSRLSSRVSHGFGIYAGEVLRRRVEKYLYVKTGIHHLTFKELHALHLKNPAQYRDLMVTGVNLNTSQETRFDYWRTPDDIISDTVRISLAIPLFFKPHTRFQKTQEGKRAVVQPEHLYVDGGIMHNYPISCFDHYGFQVPHEQQASLIQNDPTSFWKKQDNPHTLGLRLLNSKNVDYFQGLSDAPTQDIQGFVPYFKALLQTILNKENSDHVYAQEQWRSIYIDSQGIDTFAFNLTDEEKTLLKTAGQKATQSFLDNLTQSEPLSPRFL